MEPAVTISATYRSVGCIWLRAWFYTRVYFFFLIFWVHPQEMGLTDEDLAYIGVKNAAQRRALKMAAGGIVELMLHVEISGFFNFNSELVSEKMGPLPPLLPPLLPH